MFIKIYIITILIVICNTIKLSSVDKTYQKGIKAYTGERWSQCIVQFEESLHLYKVYMSSVINCRLQCNSKQYEPEIKENIEDLKIYEVFFMKRDCLSTCQEKSLEDYQLQNDFYDTVLANMQMRKPYEYLHLCYFQMNALTKAASSAYTYLLAHPKDETMKNNLDFYIQLPEVDRDQVVDLLAEDYTSLYKIGKKAYNQNNWHDTVANMEEVITDYIYVENKCRMECAGQPEQQWSSEFVITISNSIASLLHCQQQCQDLLKHIDYNSGIEFLADVLNYIQISYYHLDKLEDAAKSVASYLALMPDDEDMLQNKKIYQTLIDQKAFVGRSDIVYYIKRDLYEKKLLSNFHKRNGNDVNSNGD